MSSLSTFSSVKHGYHIEPAIIKISNLRLRTYIGFNSEEQNKQQDVIINAEISYEANMAYTTDSELSALNYKVITKNIIHHVEQGRFRLLEKLASDLLHIVMSENQVIEAYVSVDKPNALRFSDSVSIKLSAKRK